MTRRSRRVVVGFLVLLATLLSGCGGEAPRAGRTAPPTPTTDSSPHASPSGPARVRPIRLAFAGDIHFEGASRRALDGFGPITATLRHADLTMANLETAITTGGTPTPGKAFTFRAPPAAFTALRRAGIDVVTMANNHGVDYGPVGLADTLTAIRATHFPTVGIGRDEAQAYRPYVTTIKGTRIAIVGATDVIDSNLIRAWTAVGNHGGLASAIGSSRTRLEAEVRRARRAGDVVVVYLHWGVETVDCATAEQESLSTALLRDGATVVVGSHAHVQLGGGWRGRRYVDYGLGNFVFYATGGVTPETRSGVLTLTLEGHAVTNARWSPAVIADGLPVPLHGVAAAAGRNQWQSLRHCTDLSATP